MKTISNSASFDTHEPHIARKVFDPYLVYDFKN
jgi:hypothetical protein